VDALRKANIIQPWVLEVYDGLVENGKIMTREQGPIISKIIEG
jgi:hypothetical protein